VSSGNGQHPHNSPWRSRGAVLTLAIATVVALALDLASKSLAFQHVAGAPQRIHRSDVLQATDLRELLDEHEPVTVIPGLLDFTLVLNPGAVFGMGAGRRMVFVVFTVAALIFGLWMFGSWTRPRDRVAHTAIALLLAGGLGNLYDRLVYACVRDFIHPLPGVQMPFGLRNPLDGGREIWPYVSNVADLWLLIGIAMLMVFLWRSGDAKKPVSERPSGDTLKSADDAPGKGPAGSGR
jgi:signal peptidase II